MEGDGRNVTNLEVKQFKKITKGPRGQGVDTVREREGGDGGSHDSARRAAPPQG